MVSLTKEQQEVVDTWGVGLCVIAGAGSGKTTTLSKKCEVFLQKNPKSRFIAVSFTERSTSDLRKKISEFTDLSLHRVLTIHGLCASILRDFPEASGIDPDETILSASESNALWIEARELLFTRELPLEVKDALDHLLKTRGFETLIGALDRVRELIGFGVLNRFSPKKDEQCLLKISQFVLERYERLKSRKGVLDFDDLELYALKALDEPKVQDYYRNKYGLLLVDEFQDTNSTQALLIEKMARADFSNLCVVGDPKQSIYAFRDADVSVFEEFSARLPQKITLHTNFRSEPKILDYVNDVCAWVFEKSLLSYESLSPGREQTKSDPLKLFEIESPTDLAKFLKIKMNQGENLEDYALLLRKIRGNEDWLRALTKEGIPIAVGSGGLFWSDPRVRECMAFLRAWSFKDNELSSAIFLRAPWVGVSDLELDEWKRSGKGLLNSFFEKTSHPVALKLTPLRQKPLTPGELLLKLLELPEIEKELGSQALGLWHRCEELSLRGYTFSEIVRELSNQLELEVREKDVPPPKNQGQLLVLTLHGAKGLEFKHVLLVDFDLKPKRSQNSRTPLFWDRRLGVYLPERDEQAEIIETPELEKWKNALKQKELQESARLFYVALTRAKETLSLFFLKDLELPLSKAKKEEMFLDHWRVWALRFAKLTKFSGEYWEFSKKLLDDKKIKKNPINIWDPTPKRPRFSVTEWNLLNQSEQKLRDHYTSNHIDQTQTLGISESLHFYDAREIGIEVHRLIEKNLWDELTKLEKETAQLSAQSIKTWWQNLENQGWDQIYSELPFELRIGSETIVGKIDRLLVKHQSENEFSGLLIDYKTTKRQKTDAQWLSQYSFQMNLYARAVVGMEPKLKNQLKAVLLEIYPQGVREIEVPLELLDLKAQQKIDDLAIRAQKLIAQSVLPPL